MKKGLTIAVVMILFVGVALLAGCGGSGGSAPAVREASGASMNGIINGLTGACDPLTGNGAVAENNPNCVLVCDPDNPKCGQTELLRASATGLLNGVCGACANNPAVAASNPNCALCCDPDNPKCGKASE
ncbi:MAG: hypothetical protein AB1546_05620 [bacterium]